MVLCLRPAVPYQKEKYANISMEITWTQTAMAGLRWHDMKHVMIDERYLSGIAVVNVFFPNLEKITKTEKLEEVKLHVCVK